MLYSIELDNINCFALVAITAALTFSSFYFEQNEEKLIKYINFKKRI